MILETPIPKEKTLRIHAISAYPVGPSNFAAETVRSELQVGAGELWGCWEENPKLADIILFMEHHHGSDPLFLKVFKHPLFRLYPNKCYLYHDSDYVFPVIKGIYPSSEKNSENKKFVSSPYFFQICENSYVTFIPDSLKTRSYLYSFSGAFRTHPCRHRLQNLTSDPRAAIVDTSAQNGWLLTPVEQDLYHQRYAGLLRDSQFILCPRGISPCSYRLTESMKMGRVPVVISDKWNFPSWIPWQEFSLVVPERDISSIPEILRERESDADVMGMKARQVWEEYLAPMYRTRSIVRLLQYLNGAPQARTWFPTAIAATLLLAFRSAQGRCLLRQQVKQLAKR